MTALSELVNKVHCCDAIELMRRLPDASVDAIISDPPYDMTELTFEQVIDWQAFWVQARRVLKSPNCPTVLFSQQPFTTDLINSNRRAWRDEIIWEKTMPVGFLNANRMPLNCHENIQIFADKGANYWPQMETTSLLVHEAVRKDQSAHYGNVNRVGIYKDDGSRYPRSVWKFAQRDTAFSNTLSLHPTAKPIPLMKRLVTTYTAQNAVILDPFCGSGSTAIAARNLNRQFIVGDQSPEYCAIAEKRLAQPFTPMFKEMMG